MTRRRQHLPIRAGFLVALAVVCFWATMMTLLVRRELHQGRGKTSQPLAIESSDSWLVAELQDGTRAGYFHVLQEPEDREGRSGGLLRMEAQLYLTILGRPAELRLEGQVWRPLVPDEAVFRFQVSTQGHELQVSGTVGNGDLRGEVFTAGESILFNYPVGQDLLFTGGLGSATALPALEPGEEAFVDLFDPIALAPGRARIRCVGEENLRVKDQEILTRILTLTSPGLEARAWIDKDGQVLRLESPFGIVIRAASQEEAQAEPLDSTSGGHDSDALLELTAVRPTGERPRRDAGRMRVRIKGGPEPVRTMEILSPPEPFDPSLDVAPSQADLAADPLVQSDHPRIKEQALAIVAEDSDRWQKAKLIHHWVFDNIHKTPVLSLPSALDVLESREGDCNEHTVLFVALARAAKIPARIAIGLVWSDDLEGFYYHAWPEVFTDRWIPMDPTLGQEYADATHIRLLTGNIDRWTELVRYVGRLEIKVLEVDEF